MVLRVVDGGIASVIGSTLGIVLPSQSAWVGGGGGGIGSHFGLAGASTCRHYIRNLKRMVVLGDGVCVGLAVGRPHGLCGAWGVSCGMFVPQWV